MVDKHNMSDKPTSSDSVFITGISAGSAIIGIGEFTSGIVLQVQEAILPTQKLLCGKYKVLGGHDNLTDIIVEHMPVHQSSIEKMNCKLRGTSARRFEDVLSAVLAQLDDENRSILNEQIFSTQQWQQIS